MNLYILAANVLTGIAFLIHTFAGDEELHVIELRNEDDGNFRKREKWTMTLYGWHWISVDLLLVSIGLALINFSQYFVHENVFSLVIATT